MVVEWITRENEEAHVRYRQAGTESPWTEVQAVTTPFPDHQPYYEHVGSIKGLLPNTSYRFTIGDNPETSTGFISACDFLSIT